MEHKEDLHPQIVIRDTKDKEKVGYYSIPAGAQVMIKAKEKVVAGFIGTNSSENGSNKRHYRWSTSCGRTC